MFIRNCKKIIIILINIFDGYDFGLYTVHYEYYKQIFCKTAGCHIYYAVDDFNRIGMDYANYVHDEIPVELWCRFWQFHRPDGTVDTVYCIYCYSFRHIYRNYICI